jgi:hypothetical protein
MQTGHPTSSREGHNSIRRSTVMALASASEEAPPRYTSVTSRLRRKRQEVTIGSPPKTTTNTRSTISASTTRVVVATQRAHHLSEARPNLASWPSPVKLLKIRHNPERMTINRDTLPPPRSDVLWTCTCREPIWLRNLVLSRSVLESDGAVSSSIRIRGQAARSNSL